MDNLGGPARLPWPAKCLGSPSLGEDRRWDARELSEGGTRAQVGREGGWVKLRPARGMVGIDTNVPADVDGPTRSSARR